MNMFEDPKYKAYLQDQYTDTIGAGLDYKYLDYLTKTLMPNFDYKTAKVLDVGGSAFNSWDYFLEHFQNQITGIDIGQQGLELCKAAGKTGMIEQDAHKMDERFEPESFDLIFSSHAFEHMFDLPRVLRNCAKILKSGGFLYFALPMPSFNWGRGHYYDVPNNEAMLKMCKDSGFSKVLHEELVRDLRFRPEQEMVGLVQK